MTTPLFEFSFMHERDVFSEAHFDTLKASVES
jgi:hypothetical protein